MTNKLSKMPSVEGVGLGQTASVRLPRGLTYEALYIVGKADIDSAGVADIAVADWGDVIGEIRLMVNGDAKITIDAADLVSLNKFYGTEMVAGMLPLNLARTHMRTIGGERQTSYGTLGMDTFMLEFDIVGSGVASISLSVYAVQSLPTPWGPHLGIKRFFRNQGVTGEAQIDDIPRGAYAMLAAHIKTADIGEVQVLGDNREIIDTVPAVRDGHHKRAGRTPQSGFTHVDFHAENILAEALPMALQDFRINADFTSTGNFAIYTEGLYGA